MGNLCGGTGNKDQDAMVSDLKTDKKTGSRATKNMEDLLMRFMDEINKVVFAKKDLEPI